MFGLIMRIFSFAYHIFLGLVMAAVGFVAWVSEQSLQIDLLPWKGTTLTYTLLGLGILAIVVTALAIKRIVPVLFVAWSAVVVIMLVRGYFLSPYHIGPDGLKTALLITFGSLLALLGSALQMRSKKAQPAAA